MKRNSILTLASAFDTIGSSVDAAVEQFERRLEVQPRATRIEEGGWSLGRGYEEGFTDLRSCMNHPLIGYPWPYPDPLHLSCSALPSAQLEKQLVATGGAESEAGDEGGELYCLCQQTYEADTSERPRGAAALGGPV